MFIIYTISDCSYCDKAKELLKKFKLSYNEVKLTREEFLNNISTLVYQETNCIYDIKTVPQIVYKKSLIGGFNDLSIYLDNYYTDFNNSDDF